MRPGIGPVGPEVMTTTLTVVTADIPSPFSPKVIAPGEGKTVMLFGVRFGYKVVTADCGGTLAVMEVEIPAPRRQALTGLGPPD